MPSIWDVRRELMGEYVVARAAIDDHADFDPYRREFTACVEARTGVPASTIAELEQLLIADADAVDAIACEPIWNEGILAAEDAAMKTFVDRHSDALEAQRQIYAGAVDRIREDDAFVDWVSAFLAR